MWKERKKKGNTYKQGDLHRLTADVEAEEEPEEEDEPVWPAGGGEEVALHHYIPEHVEGEHVEGVGGVGVPGVLAHGPAHHAHDRSHGQGRGHDAQPHLHNYKIMDRDS